MGSALAPYCAFVGSWVEKCASFPLDRGRAYIERLAAEFIERVCGSGEAVLTADTEVLTTWLKNLHFEEYTHLFLQAGYDMPTISRMTPEDLTAIGITKPAHRRKLKSEISNLNISDGIPDYKPDNLLTWLKLLRLEQYYGSLCQQGYATVDRVADLTWEDLEDIGIQKLGHQKKLMLAIKRCATSTAVRGRRCITGTHGTRAADMGQLLAARPGSHVPVPMGHPYQAVPSVNQPPCERAPPHANAVPPLRSDTDPSTPQLRTFRQQSPPRMGGNFYRAGSGDSLILQQQHFSGPAFHQPPMQGADLYQHDFVSMQVRSPNRGRSLESLEDGGPAYQSHSSSDWYHMVSSWRQHGYDTDSEVVRQVSHGYDYGYEPDGTATLHRPRGLVKPRPVAKVAARALLDSPDLDYDPKDLDPKLSSDWPDTGSGAKRSPAPTPPKRTNSIRRQQEANIAETAFATCVQSLTSRFTMATTRDEPPLPPPPPTRNVGEQRGRRGSAGATAAPASHVDPQLGLFFGRRTLAQRHPAPPEGLERIQRLVGVPPVRLRECGHHQAEARGERATTLAPTRHVISAGHRKLSRPR
ncbi:hypothetical protein MRX96_001069 [Rhipicephalus microplus]